MFDAHNHVHFEAFDRDRDDTVVRAIQVGVTGMVVAGYDSARRDVAKSLAQRDGIWATAGVHPWSLRNQSPEQTEAELQALHEIDWSKFCALGELGLDWFIDDKVSRDHQTEVFRAQLGIARDRNLPIVVHCVRANSDLIQWFKKDGLPGRGAMIHSFWGSAQEARQLVDLGCKLSVGTQLTRTQPDRIVAALNEVGLEHLFVETDAPSRPPAQVDGERNEPAYLPCVVESLALVLGTTAQRVAEATEANIRNWLDLGDERLQASSE